MNLEEYLLKFAQIEEDGDKLYKQASEKCSEKLKSVMVDFSSEEKQHRDIMLKLYEDNNLKGRELPNNMKEMIDDQINHLNNAENLNFHEEMEFFKFALGMEKISINIYEKFLEIFEVNSYEYKTFQALIKEEKRHMIYILNKLYELN